MIQTPDTHPNDDVIGQMFKSGRDGHTYYCDSYDPRRGYWMTRIDAPPENRADDDTMWRTNVSERAINRTYHRIHS